MGLMVCGFNHKSATIQEREPFQLSRSELMEATRTYQDLTGCEEAAVVVTCNRVEFYQFTPEKSEQLPGVIEFYRQRGVAKTDVLKDFCYCRQKTTVARHIFRVASGLDSMVLGEDQVFHQLKEAYSSACAVGGPGKILHKLFHMAFQVGKQVRAETEIAVGPRSVPGAALELLRNRFNSRKPKSALVCGVNELTDIVLEGLTRWEVPAIVANRTPEKAEKFVATYKARSVPLDSVQQIIPNVDIVLSATASPDPILNTDSFQAMEKRDDPTYVVDLAIPRDVSSEVGDLPGVILFDLQDIQRYLEQVDHHRSKDIPSAEAIIEDQVSQYSIWRTKERQKSKVLKMHRELNKLRKIEIERFKDGFHLSEYRALDAFSQALVKNFMRLLPEVLDPEETVSRKTDKSSS